MRAFNISAVGVPRHRKCVVCDYPIETEGLCRIRSRTGAIRSHSVGDVLVLHSNGDAVAVLCVTCNHSPQCDFSTPFDGRYALIIQDGNVYAHIKGGRDGEVMTIAAQILTPDPITVSKTVLIQR